MAYINLKKLAFEAFDHIEKKQFKEAESKLVYLLNVHPREAILAYYLGCMFLDQKKYGFAIMAYEYALQLQPDFDQCLNNLATAYRRQGDISQCAKYLERAIEIARRPDYVSRMTSPELAVQNLSDYLGNLGSFHIAKGTPNIALGYFEEALKLVPSSGNVLWNQGLAYLELGDYEKGFIGYDFGDRISDDKERSYHGGPKSTKVWPGRDTKKDDGTKPTVVVYGEQGIGDEIMFASILPDIMKDADVILECHPRLMDLFRLNFPGIPIFGTRKATEVNWAKNYKIDFKIAIGSLGKHYRKKKEDFPGTPYLKADPKLFQNMKEKLAQLGDKPKIGISWKGGIGITNKIPRCIPLETLKPLFNFDANFISLQYHVNARAEIDVFHEQMGKDVITHWQDVVDDYDLTAALLPNLDLIISVPQSVVHLAGALGVPTIQMCPVQALWQMGVYGQNMPWYESVQNFWQSVDGDWKTVVDNVCKSLELEGYKCL
jgi:tetratricopeptide (TPR) repeat protein